MNHAKILRPGIALWAMIATVCTVAADAPLPSVSVSGLHAGPPTAQGHAYQVPVRLTLANPGETEIPETQLSLHYLTLSGKYIPCVNQLLPTAIPALPPGATHELAGDILIPAVWYHGAGRLRLSLQWCVPDCLELPLSTDSIELFLY